MPGRPDYASFLSPISAARQPSAIRQLIPLTKLPGMISLGGGQPNPCTFPIDGLSFSIKGRDAPVQLTEAELGVALQYSATAGIHDLNQLLRRMLMAEHGPPLGQEDFEVCVTNGSQEAVTRAMEMLLGPGDSILVELPTYSGSLASLNPSVANVHGVATDEDGLVPATLLSILEGWDPARDGGAKPKVLYTVPTGGNPSGACIPEARRREIYAIAQDHDLIILEDDPYYYLQFRDKPLPSFLSMDVDGRVVRFDSFSKVLSSGLRVGFASGPKALMDRLVLHGQAASLHPSGLSQAVTLKLLQEWGEEGFAAHRRDIVRFYRGQRDAFLAAADKHLTGRAEWRKDIGAGMFAWIKINGIEDSEALITEKARDAKVLFVPGRAFFPEGAPPTPYLRAAFSMATPEDIDEALRRLASLLPAP